MPWATISIESIHVEPTTSPFSGKRTVSLLLKITNTCSTGIRYYGGVSETILPELPQELWRAGKLELAH
ncbi:hypothetical protein, partial [Amycolatopsis sp. cmx-11-12]|uniref:hypothetical protein n=1 Tax=Amycolatopsis sp. cmx-11-12 TaxID=2785795 RepID=UPI003917D366